MNHHTISHNFVVFHGKSHLTYMYIFDLINMVHLGRQWIHFLLHTPSSHSSPIYKEGPNQIELTKHISRLMMYDTLVLGL